MVENSFGARRRMERFHPRSVHQTCLFLAYESQRAGRRLYFLSKAAFLKKLITPRRCGRRLATLPERKVRQSERRSPVSFQEAQRAQKPVQEARDISCRITHVARSPDTISMHEHNGTGPELAPAPRRQLRGCGRATRGTGVDCGVLRAGVGPVSYVPPPLCQRALCVFDCCGSI